MGAGERNVTSAIYCVNHNSLHWNDVFSIIAATEVDSNFVGERFRAQRFQIFPHNKIYQNQLSSDHFPDLYHHCDSI